MTGRISTQCSLTDAISGELTVEASAVPICSIDIHLFRVESVLLGERIVTETSLIQTTQACNISHLVKIVSWDYTIVNNFCFFSFIRLQMVMFVGICLCPFMLFFPAFWLVQQSLLGELPTIPNCSSHFLFNIFLFKHHSERDNIAISTRNWVVMPFSK